MEINLCIWCQDDEYISHLAYYLMNNPDIHFSIIRMSQIEEVSERMTNQVVKNECHMLWLIDDCYRKAIGELNIHQPRVMWFSEAWQMCDDNALNYIFRYQRGEEIEKQIVMFFLSQQSGQYRARKHTYPSKLIGITALNNTTSSTRFGREWGHYLVEQGKTVLWLSFVQFPSYQQFLKGDSLYSMEDLIIQLLKGKDIVGLIEAFRTKDLSSGIFFLKPQRVFEDLSLISNQVWLTHLSNLRDNDNYDYIFIELPSAIDTNNTMLLSLCDRWITVSEDDEMGEWYQKNLTEYLEITQQEALITLRKRIYLQALPKQSLRIYDPHWKEHLAQDGS